MDGISFIVASAMRLTSRPWSMRRRRPRQQFISTSTVRATATTRKPDTSASASASPSSIYIHLPFCAQRCSYCAFTVFVTGKSSIPSLSAPPHPTHVTYIDTLCLEIESFFKLHAHSPLTSIQTIYFGGGTPSLIHPHLFRKLMNTIGETVPLSRHAEITLEMDPLTFTTETALKYKQYGVTRASIGVQSFNDELLSSCNRYHKSEHIMQAVDDLKSVGLHNISLDLMCGLPGQTEADWKNSVEMALSLKPKHVSIYDLTLEEGTEFGNKFIAGMNPLPSEKKSVDMLTFSSSYLRNHGYDRYEISNFSINGYESKHNLMYWHGQSFYAFGVGCTSLVNDIRFMRPKSMKLYTKYVHDLKMHCLINDDDDVDVDVDVDSVLFPGMVRMKEIEKFEDYVINGMRLMRDGVDMKQIKKDFGLEYLKKFENALNYPCNHYIADGFLIIDRDGSDNKRILSVRLSETGSMIENSIVSDLLYESIWKR